MQKHIQFDMYEMCLWLTWLCTYSWRTATKIEQGIVEDHVWGTSTKDTHTIGLFNFMEKYVSSVFALSLLISFESIPSWNNLYECVY